MRKKAKDAEVEREENPVTRFHPDPEYGLSGEEVGLRQDQGLTNADSGIKTKTEWQIIRENVFTFFNILNFILAAAVLLVGSPRNALFMGVILSNIVIGCFQGIRAKRTIDKLSLISSPKARVIRDGEERTIAVEEIVLDDIMRLSAGNQICADATVVEGECEVNESLITGESDPVTKTAGDSLLSGSFIVSGSCLAQVEHVGKENYATRITGDAKYIKKRTSEIMDSIDKIVKVIGFAIIPIGALLFYKQFFILGDTFKNSVVSTAAAVVGMIPEGLVLLVSVAFAVSVVKLSSKKTLVQDMYCIETLARVDTLCLDKTGTITEGSMQVDELLPLEGYTEEEMRAALSALMTVLTDENPTSNALREYLGEERSAWTATQTVPFSSARKWSGAYFPGHGLFVMGAGEFVLGEKFEEIRELAERYSENGQRVLVLAQGQEGFLEKELPGDIEAVGLLLLSDKLRREAPRTLRYFADQGVDLKVISGDNPVTVSNIAKRAGLQNAERYVDAGTLKTQEEIEDAVERYTVFGRVTPQQKLDFVKALKARGHTVAMTGDGVNDVLALKEADCSIAMASGSDAARTVSNLVLLDSNFSSLPLVVQEGRRSINNLQRSSSLFLVKTIFSALIGVLFIFLDYTYPFMPIQLTLISSFTIGVPSFILALEPNRDRLKGRFIFNVLRMCLPASLTMTANILALCAISGPLELTNVEMSTLAVLMTAFTGFIMLFRVCTPFNGLRGTLFSVLLVGFIANIVFFRDFYSLCEMSVSMLAAAIPLTSLSITMMLALFHLSNHIFLSPARTLKKIKPLNGEKKERKKRLKHEKS